MRYFFQVFFLLLLTATSTAQSGDFQLVRENGKVGLADASGRIIIPAIYEELGWSDGKTEPLGNLIGYRLNNKWGLLTLENEKRSKEEYTRLYPAKSTSLFVASKKGKYSHQDFLGLINSDNKVALPFKYSSVEVHDLRAIVSIKYGHQYQYGLVDLGNKAILPINYKDIYPIGNMRFAVKNDVNKYAIYAESGRQVYGFQLDSISAFTNGYAIIYQNHLRGLIDTGGRIIHEPEFKAFDLNRMKTKSFDTWQLIKNRKVISSWQMDSVLLSGNQNYKVISNDHQWIVNAEGQEKTPTFYNYISESNQGLRMVRIKSKWGVIDSSNNYVLKPKYDSLIEVGFNYYGLEREGWSLFDRWGLKKSTSHYDEIGLNSGNYFPVKRKGKWGFVDRSGEEVIHCVYQEVSPMHYNMVAVKFHDAHGIIDKYGNWVVLPQKGRLEVINDQFYMQYSGKLKTLKSFEEGTIYFTENPIEIKDDHLLEHLSDGGLWKIDFRGTIVNRDLPQQRFQEIRSSSEGLFAIKLDNRYGFVDNQNRLIVANRYEDVGDFKEDMVAVKLLSRWGYIDRYEQLVIQPVYDYASQFNNGLAIVKSKEGYGIIDKDGRHISTFNYDAIELLPNGKFLIRRNGKVGLLSTTGHLLINAKYDMLEELDNGKVKVQLFGKYGVLAADGVDLVPIIYDQLTYDHRYDLYLAKKKSPWENLFN